MISEQLSLLPLRPIGVRSTIEFLAVSHRTPQAGQDADGTRSSTGPALPLDVLQQSSKLLSSVPKAMTPEQYFPQIAAQLLALLDDWSEPALRKAAAFIIGSGILGKRSIGSPGSIGWTLFVVPIFEALNPAPSSTSHKRKASELDVGSPNPPLVSQSDVECALGRLSTLVLSHPSPGLTGRLIRPLLLPLWALANVRGTSFAATEASKCALALIAHFLRLVGTSANACLIADNLICDGAVQWKYEQFEDKGICIRSKPPLELQLDNETQLDQALSRIDTRIDAFCRLLSTGQMDADSIVALFLHVFEQHSQASTRQHPEQSSPSALLKTLSSAKLVQGIAENFSDQLTKDPAQVLRLVHRILQKVTGEGQRTHSTGVSKPSLSTLGNIVAHREEPKAVDDDAFNQEDSVMVVLSLLNALAVSSEYSQWSVAFAELREIRTKLETIAAGRQSDDSLALQIRTTVALLANASTSNGTALSSGDIESALDIERTLALITADIASDLPPIRRSALHALQALIKSSDAPLDVPPVAMLLLEVIRTDKEEFVYLAAVQTAVQLAVRRNLGYTSRLFVESFQDIDEQTGVDGRLRIGETLASIAEELGNNATAQHADVIQSMCQSLLGVAGRRGHREREQLVRQREERLKRRKRKEAERAWGGEVPELEAEDENNEYQVLTPSERERRLRDLEAIESIVKGWEDTGFEEDVRIRASALSVFGRLFESCPRDFQDSNLTTSAIDLCLSILSLELEPAKAILRRSAVLAIFGALKGVDAELEAGQSIGAQPVMKGEDWSKVEKVLRWVADTDPDDLTVGHAETVLKGLEAVRMKILVGAVRSSSEPQDLNKQLRGLNVKPNIEVTERKRGPQMMRKPIIEELE